MTIRVLGIDMPVAPRHVASDSLDGDALVAEVVGAMHDFGQRAGLPGNLVDRHLSATTASPTGRHERIHHLLGKQHKGVMVMAVMEEVTSTVFDGLQRLTHVR